MNKLLVLFKRVFPDARIMDGMDMGQGNIPEWDSLGHFNYLMEIEQEYEIRFTPQEISELKTISKIKNALDARGLDT